MSKFDGVNAVVWVATTRPSTDSVAWWLTAPNSIQVDCGCPESGTVMLREYTASFTSVKPCLYQPPPGTRDRGRRPTRGREAPRPGQVDRGDRGGAGSCGRGSRLCCDGQLSCGGGRVVPLTAAVAGVAATMTLRRPVRAPERLQLIDAGDGCGASGRAS